MVCHGQNMGELLLLGDGHQSHQSIFIGIRTDVYTHYRYSFVGCVTITRIPCFHPNTHVVPCVPINILQFITRKLTVPANRIAKLELQVFMVKQMVT